MRIFLLFLMVISIFSFDQFGGNVAITYGTVIKLVNTHNHYIVHSHDVFFGRGGVMSVTGFRTDDLGSYWQLNQKFKGLSKTIKDPLLCGDTVTISSVIMGYFLRVQQTQFGLTTQLLPMVHGMNKNNIDEKINFQIQCVDRQTGTQIHFQDKIRFKHQITGKYVSLNDMFAYHQGNCGRGCSIAGQIELHALDNIDETTTVFSIKSGISFDQNHIKTSEQ